MKVNFFKKNILRNFWQESKKRYRLYYICIGLG